MWILGYIEDIKCDLSVFHRVDDPRVVSCQYVIPKIERLLAFKGALRATAEREKEELNTTPTGKQRDVQKVYDRPEDNVEANVLGLFEKGTG